MISVLMCTYNRENYLRHAIDSVLNQTYKDFEFIIMDDGSTDGTEELIHSYQDPRIRYYKMARNSYYCYAANEGLSRCQGTYVAFMNSDDIWELDKLQKQWEFMEHHSSYGACFTAVTLIDCEERDVTDEYPEMRDFFQTQYASQKECIQHLITKRNTLCHPSALVRKELLDAIGGFNLLYCQLADYDLWIRLVTWKPIFVMNERLTRFRWEGKNGEQISSLTEENAVRAFNEQVLVVKHAIENLSDEKFREFFGDRFKNSSSMSHMEIEFEKAFFLLACLEDAPELKVLGIEKLEDALAQPGAMETLREHFHMDIFDIYAWNKEHMYKTPWLMKRFEELEQRIRQQEQKLEQLQKIKIHFEKLSGELEAERLQSEWQKAHIHEQNLRLEYLEQQLVEKEQLIDTYANSTSWKMTEPFRRFTSWLHKKR